MRVTVAVFGMCLSLGAVACAGVATATRQPASEPPMGIPKDLQLSSETQSDSRVCVSAELRSRDISLGPSCGPTFSNWLQPAATDTFKGGRASLYRIDRFTEVLSVTVGDIGELDATPVAYERRTNALFVLWPPIDTDAEGRIEMQWAGGVFSCVERRVTVLGEDDESCLFGSPG
jgi:hypothetical protein